MSHNVTTLAENARQAVENGSEMAGCYLACICGMWYHTLGLKYVNPFEHDSNSLYTSFHTGYDNSKQSVQMNAVLRRQFHQKEEAEDKERIAEKGKKKENQLIENPYLKKNTPQSENTSFWKRKLW